MATIRKLTAIAFFDVVNYTGMMNKDEAGTLRLLEEFRKILYPAVKDHSGSVLKELGDGALVCFDSALDAITCSTRIQKEVKAIAHLRLRIGIHVGDVVVEEKDVFGEGVNIAARIQPLATPGGIVVTEDVWRQARNQNEVSFLSLGARNLKGVRTPVKVYAVSSEGIETPRFNDRVLKRPAVKRGMILSSLIAVIVAGYFAATLILGIDTGYVPSLAILQLKNLGPQDDDPYTYGITEDLIVDVAKAGLIRVAPMKDILSIPKNESSVKELARQLNVRYIMDGSLKREGAFFRVTAHIIDVPTGLTLWADRIQMKVTEASVLQGRLASAIIEALKLRPTDIVKKDITKAKTVHPEAYEFYLRGKFLLEKKKTKEDVILARGMYERAMLLDSTFVPARLGFGETYELQCEFSTAQNIYNSALRISRSTNEKLDEAKSLMRIGTIQWNLANYPAAQDYFTKALALFDVLGDRDGQAKVYNCIGNAYLYQGNYTKTLESYQRSLSIAQELGKRADEAITLNNIGVGYQVQGQYAKAIESYNQSLLITRELGDRRNEALALNNLGYFSEITSDYEKSLDYYQKSAKISNTLGDRRTECITLKNIGNIYQIQRDFSNALDYYSRSRSIAQHLGDRSTEAEIVGNFGRLHFEKQEFRAAVDSLLLSTNLYMKIGEEQNLVWMTSWLGLAEANAGEKRLAEIHAQKIEEKTTSAADWEYYIEILWNLHRTYDILGKTAKAHSSLKRVYDEIIASANKIQDAAIRQNYLTKNKMNSSIIAEWEKTKR